MHLKLIAALTLSLGLSLPAAAETAAPREVMRILHMLDYIGVDYPEFVQNGEILDQGEYVEQVEFAREISERIAKLPDHAQQAALTAAATELRSAIDAKADGEQIAELTSALSLRVRQAYPITEAPRAAPDMSGVAGLFAEQCSACHGETGVGDGLAGAGMEPPPTNFLEAARQRQRSVFGLYNIITLGVEGTGMPSFAQLPEDQRWALAFHVGQLIYADDERQTGQKLWSQGQQAGIETLQTLTTILPADLEASHGEQGTQLMAYLRANPQAIAASASPLAVAGSKLTASQQAYVAGDAETAMQLALDAYLEGFELAEAAVAAVDNALMREIEAAMLDYRQLIHTGQPSAQLQASAAHIQGLLAQAEARLDGGGLDATGSFLGSYIILTREGLEAILLLAAMLAFLSRTERHGAKRYVHAGWITALVAGGATWYAASHLINISGAGRELTEGVAALVAAAVLLSVGLWLHNKSYAARWQAYVADRIGQAMSNAGLWGLAGLAFIATYREVFETVLFYQALWAQGDHQAIAWGFGAAVISLAIIAIALFRYSMRLPIRQFFAASAFFIVALAVIFTGKGVAALQEAGLLAVHSVNFVRVPMLGIYPTMQVLAIQGTVLVLVVGGFAWNHLSLRRQTA